MDTKIYSKNNIDTNKNLEPNQINRATLNVQDEAVEEEESEEDQEEVIAKPPHKFPFKFKQNNNGNILTVHHTVQEQNKLIRIRLGACAFSERGHQFVAIDKRGNVFVFDLSSKRHWRLPQIVPKVSVIRASIQKDSHYVVGNKLGQLYLLDVEKSRMLRTTSVSSDAIVAISFPGQPLQPSHLALVHAGPEAILFDLDTFTATHRLDFDEALITLKFACYLPHSEQIFTCFTNDTLHIWSGVTLNTLRVSHPIKARDRKLRLMEGSVENSVIPEFSLVPERKEFELNCPYRDYANGLIVAFSCSPDGRLLCLCTLDNYLLLLSAYTFEVQNMFRLRDFTITQCAFLPKPKETLILALTSVGQVVLLDCQNSQFRIIVQPTPNAACHMSISCDGKLLAVLAAANGEADIFSTGHLYNTLKSQEECMELLKVACKQNKPLSVGSAGQRAANECLNADITKMLNRDRLLNILNEFGCYPEKYRSLIWCALLQLPGNQCQFQQLLKMGTPAVVKQRSQTLKLKNETLKRALVKIWSCLAHWCKVFAYSDFLPHLIFPFVKLFPKNALVTFEICSTLLLNHFQLWFEFHPLEPSNYLGMCENILQRFDSELTKFYATMNVRPQHYAWSLLANAFAEVLDEQQWLCLWDSLMTQPTYLLIFCAAAYNILQREIIFRLPDKATIVHFFHVQNPIDVSKLIAKALGMVGKCPPTLHPKRYIKDFQAIPKNVYPKFLNYPKEWVTQHEQEVSAIQMEQRSIDARIRQLEFEEFQMMERLENGLKAEEHAKRMKEMEKLYQNTLKREEERIACQRKMLLLYQKEIRSRKYEVVATLQESERRKRALQMEKELDALMHGIERDRLRNDTNLILAEDEIRNQDLQLMAEKFLVNTHTVPLSQRYRDDIQRLGRERSLLNNNLVTISLRPDKSSIVDRDQTNLDDIKKQIDEIQKEFKCLTSNK